jgi:gamma-tubulin complex component 5
LSSGGFALALRNPCSCRTRLEEKFRIRNNEDLADALEMRISKLKTLTDISSADSFIPEILHLLLELSDKPLTKSRLSDLKELQPSPPPRALTWDDIIADDPLEGEIWDDVDFGAESSDAWSENEVEYLPIRERLKAKKEPEIPENKRKRKPDAEGEHEKEFNYRVAGVEAFMVDGDRKGLQSLKETQYWACKVDAIDSEVDVALSGAAGRTWNP